MILEAVRFAVPVSQKPPVSSRPEPDVLSSFFRRWARARALTKVGLPLTGGGARAGCGEPAGMIILLSQQGRFSASGSVYVPGIKAKRNPGGHLSKEAAGILLSSAPRAPACLSAQDRLAFSWTLQNTSAGTGRTRAGARLVHALVPDRTLGFFGGPFVPVRLRVNIRPAGRTVWMCPDKVKGYSDYECVKRRIRRLLRTLCVNGDFISLLLSRELSLILLGRTFPGRNIL